HGQLRARVTAPSRAGKSGTKERGGGAPLYGEGRGPTRAASSTSASTRVSCASSTSASTRVSCARSSRSVAIRPPLKTRHRRRSKAHRTGLDRIEKPAAWLLVVGSREVFRRARRSRRELELWASLPGRRGEIGTVADRADLLAALGELSERQRTVVVARYFYGLSYDEIASHFEIKSGTVGATLHQAIERLRQIQLSGRLARGAMR